jgi:hypothetical protein
MKMMNRIQQIWAQLENLTGVFRRIRYDAASACDLNIGLKMPENERMLVLRLPITLSNGIRKRPPSLGIRVEKVADPDDNTRFFLNLVLTELIFGDVFDVLLQDLIDQLVNVAEPTQVVRVFFNKLERWEALFSHYSSNGLSPEQQKGLFGELFVLSKLLTTLQDSWLLVESWVGQDAAIQDFRSKDWAIEVKTSSLTTNERFAVNGERQLDDSPFENLFLFYLNLDVRINSGKRLDTIITEIRALLGFDVKALLSFNQKLISAGYFEAHAANYESTGYVIRDERIFRVAGNFPRITPPLLPGVGEVRYSASITDCLPYEITEPQLFKTLA